MSAESDLALVVSPAIAPREELALSGPSAKVDPLRLPVRGDLAHIRLAGRVFVPHYAVPMPHRLKAAAPLLGAARSDAAVLAELPLGEFFAVIDMAGGWAWGQAADEGGLVGYLPLAVLEPIA